MYILTEDIIFRSRRFELLKDVADKLERRTTEAKRQYERLCAIEQELLTGALLVTEQDVQWLGAGELNVFTYVFGIRRGANPTANPATVV